MPDFIMKTIIDRYFDKPLNMGIEGCTDEIFV